MAGPTAKETFGKIFTHLLIDANNAGINSEAYATNLLTAFLNNDTFRSSILDGQDPHFSDIIKSIPRVPTNRDSMANNRVKEIIAGNTKNLTDLADAPAGATASLEQLESFRTNAFFQRLDPELARDRSAPKELRRLASIKRHMLTQENDINNPDIPDIRKTTMKGDLARLQFRFEKTLSGLTGQEREAIDKVVFPTGDRLPEPKTTTPPVKPAAVVAQVIPASLRKHFSGTASPLNSNGNTVEGQELANNYLLAEKALHDYKSNPLGYNQENGIFPPGAISRIVVSVLEKVINNTGEKIVTYEEKTGTTITMVGSFDETVIVKPNIDYKPKYVANAHGKFVQNDPAVIAASEASEAPPATDDKPVGGFISAANAATIPKSDVKTATDPKAGAKVVNNSIAKLPPEIRKHFAGTATPEKVAAIKAEPKPETKPEIVKYEVQRGDSLWKIAKEQYGLTSYKDIMRATDHIAQANGLEKGTDANWIKPGMEIKMPTAKQIQQPANSLDWKALAEDPKLGAAARTNTMALTN